MRPKITIREDEKKKESSVQHPIWQSEVAIPRAFRWTMHPKGHPDVSWWMKRLNTNYLNKIIEMEVYDDAEGKVFDWISATLHDAESQQLDLHHQDGTGKAIYIITFTGITISDHIADYDYKVSDVLTHKLKVYFRNMKRANKINIQ